MHRFFDTTYYALGAVLWFGAAVAVLVYVALSLSGCGGSQRALALRTGARVLKLSDPVLVQIAAEEKAACKGEVECEVEADRKWKPILDALAAYRMVCKAFPDACSIGDPNDQPPPTPAVTP